MKYRDKKRMSSTNRASTSAAAHRVKKARKRSQIKSRKNRADYDESITLDAIDQLDVKRQEIDLWQKADRSTKDSLDSQIIERARTQWQFGDWESLAAIKKKDIESHPDGALLALFAAAGKAQQGDLETAGELMRLAEKWGCNRGRVLQIMMAGVYNSLGRAALTTGQKERAHKHFEESVSISGITGDAKLITKARESEQLGQLYLPNSWKKTENAAQKMKKPSAKEELILPNYSPFSKDIKRLAKDCLEKEDIHECIDNKLYDENLLDVEKFEFCLELSDQFYSMKDNLTGLHFLRRSMNYISEVDIIAERQRLLISQKLMEHKQEEEALNVIVKQSIEKMPNNEELRKKMQNKYEAIWSSYLKAKSHGHLLLIEYLNSSQPNTKLKRKRVLIEVGSTREDILGQGSTAELAYSAFQNGLHFITVDMDPHNTKMAGSSIKKIDYSFEAVNSKGEDFLRDYDGVIDYAFLDAYDFDHGGHSAIRQSRYRKYLGQEINDEACHRMHLECAESLAKKLSEDGVICIDDTWQDESGSWTAKGTLAVPFLLENGFKVVDARNRAILLIRESE